MANPRRYLALMVAALAAPALAAGEVDTSDWVCEYCPFEEGVSGDYDVGATSVSDDSAYLGNATGYAEDGAYLNVDGEGGYTGAAQRVRWRVEDLGLDSRVVNVEGGEPGRYDYSLDWTELPYRQFFTTSTVFSDAGNASLVLPDDWVRAGTTGGFSALDGNLARRNIESDRRTLGLGGSFNFNAQVSVSADYRRRSNEGVRMFGASTFNNASLLPAPFDHTTDELEVGVRYGTAKSYLDLSWYLSDFDNGYESLSWQQPFTTAPGAESPVIAQAPDNRFQQLRLSGGYTFTEWRTVVNVTAAMGRIEQDAAFLDYTSNPNLGPAPLPRSNLDGEVETSNFSLSVSARPLSKVRVRGSYRYDERDNNTPTDLYSRVIGDTFLSGEEEVNAPYSYKRQKLSGTADWDALDMLRLSSGFEYKEYDRTLQEVTQQEEFLSYGRARLRPLQGIEVDARYGNSRREIDNYDEALAIVMGQNPLMRKYNLAYRFREFMDVRASWSPASLPISVSVTGLYADDSYTNSQLGLTSGEERSFSADFSWFVSERASLFINAGIDNLESVQLGSESFAAADWRGVNDDTFTTWGGGFTLDGIGDKLDLRVSAITSRGQSEIVVDSAAAGNDQFPDLETELDRLRLDLRYRYSETLDLTLGATYQRFKASDWALQGVAPATVPQLFSLGARPYDDDNVIIAVGFRYRMGDP
jgi:MtrB/PioB family decaheme-associated outer membrane protein